MKTNTQVEPSSPMQLLMSWLERVSRVQSSGNWARYLLECPTYESCEEIQEANPRRESQWNQRKPSRSNLCVFDDRLNGIQRSSWNREILKDESDLRRKIGDVVEAVVHEAVEKVEVQLIERVADVALEGIEGSLQSNFLAVGGVAELHKSIAGTINFLEPQGIDTSLGTTWIREAGGDVEDFDFWKRSEVASSPLVSMEHINPAHVEDSDGGKIGLSNQSSSKIELWIGRDPSTKLSPVVASREVDLLSAVLCGEHGDISLASNGIEKGRLASSKDGWTTDSDDFHPVITIDILHLDEADSAGFLVRTELEDIALEFQWEVGEQDELAA